MPKYRDLVVDLGWGDSSKGATVEALCAYRDADLVVRFNGGAQAAHNVVTPDGRHHTFRQFGSGTLLGIPTYLSRNVYVDLLELEVEANKLMALGVRDPYAMMFISSGCILVTPMHYKGDADWVARTGIATCGLGVGEAKWSAQSGHPTLLVGYYNRYRAERILDQQQQYYETEIDLAELSQKYDDILNRVNIISNLNSRRFMSQHDSIVFEGAQGVQLDCRYGTLPYVTSSNTTYENAYELLDLNDKNIRWGCMRTYPTRHGPGPFPREIMNASGAYPELHNKNNPYQGEWRVGMWDWNVLRHSINILGGRVDFIAVSHLDYIEMRYEFCDTVERELHTHIGMKAVGPTRDDRVIRI